MMTVTFLDHSGFAVTTPTAIMVFDYYKDPAHALHKILEAHPTLPVLFFVSHHHPDHYNSAIYDLAQSHKRVYILSNDVYGQTIPTSLGIQVAGMSRGDVLENLPGNIRVKAFGSTDAGISFAVTTAEGKTIFHAGDLNDWHWKDMSTPKEAETAERHFMTIVNRIAEEYPSFDVAMFPVDNRLGSDFARGAELFTEKIKVADFFPMHFGGKNAAAACDFGSYIKNPATSCHCLDAPGESVKLQ